MVEVGHSLDMKSMVAMMSSDRMRRVSSSMAKGVKKGLLVIQRHHIRQEMIRARGKKTGKGSGAPPPKLYYRSGDLARSYIITHRAGSIEGSYGSIIRRSKMLEEGGTIKPRSAKMLAIPLPGVKGRPREHGDSVFVKKSKAGNLILVKPRDGKSGRSGSLVALFLLKHTVDIPARPTLANSIRATDDEVTAILEQAWIEGLEGGKGNG